MKKLFACLTVLVFTFSLHAQPNTTTDTSWKKHYRETATRINDLVNTKLDANFDFAKSYMYGKAWITLQPHFYPTDSLRLDAKGMDIHSVAIVKSGKQSTLKYDYDGWELNIHLDKTYKNGEQYTVFVDYTSKPDEVKVQGSAAITDAKGLYFINPKGEDKDKPTEIWTQGETEANSVWVPTIDKPNQRMTDEIAMTVPAKYVTLSNGLMTSQKKNADGTRTDTWKMNLPHAPYLLFMGIGDFAIIKDSYKGKEVSYYVDKEYASVARKIFGLTPEMIAFFSRITGVDYPWQKYAQMTGHDYVSGAMENTTATLHSDAAQQDARELTDGNAWEDDVSHELFHQWFGDYVTTESWSNITLNESFANYSETLWDEYKYGKDAGDAKNYGDMQGYLLSNSGKQDLVRFYYGDKEDVFDAVSYNKGGRILSMLRNYVGDSAFFKALNLYLTTNKFKSAEAQQLRLAFEEVTGRDLNWYWNQWYYGAGNPSLEINYQYDDAAKKIQVIVTQTQQGNKIFKLPTSIDIYSAGKKTRYNVWVQDKTDTFSFASPTKPDLTNFDGDKILLCTKKENKTLDEYIFQYKNAGQYLDRREAIDFAAAHQDDAKAVAFLATTLKDKYDGLRNYSLSKLNLKSDDVKKAVEPILVNLAKNDPKRLVKAAAIANLDQYKDIRYAPLFKAALSDSSYSVSGSALEALSNVDSVGALAEAKKLAATPSRGKLASVVAGIMIGAGDLSSSDLILKSFESMPLSQNKFNLIQGLASLMAQTKDMATFKRGIDDIIKFKDAIPESFRGNLEKYIYGVVLKPLAAKKKQDGLTAQSDYILSKLPDEDKKGF